MCYKRGKKKKTVCLIQRENGKAVGKCMWKVCALLLGTHYENMEPGSVAAVVPVLEIPYWNKS